MVAKDFCRHGAGHGDYCGVCDDMEADVDTRLSCGRACEAQVDEHGGIDQRCHRCRRGDPPPGKY